MWLEYENRNTQLSDFNDDDEDFKLKKNFVESSLKINTIIIW